MKRTGTKRIGVVGAGMMASWHVERWLDLQRLGIAGRGHPVQIAGIFDKNQQRAAELANTYTCPAFTELDGLLAACDIVDVCTPTDQHADVVVSAARVGKDVICEKPMARSLQDAQRMADVCEQAGVRLFIAHVVRFFSQYEGAKAALDAGKLGSPGVIRLSRGGSFPGRWYGDYARAGGVILDLSIHDLDMARWCFGEVTQVFARGLTFDNIPECDHVIINLQFESGALGHVSGSWAYPAGKFVTALEVAGSDGIYEWNGFAPDPVLGSFDAGSDLTSVMNDMASPLAPEDDPYSKELAHALDCITTGAPFRVEPADALATLKLALAATASVKQGTPIRLSEFSPSAADVLDTKVLA
ncbi:MAG: Gfo/Idh/MocA family oxidoreductase [Deinococcota bacterium]